MFENRTNAEGVTGRNDTTSEIATATILAAALSVTIPKMLPEDYRVGPGLAGSFGTALGDMGTGNSRLIVEEARSQLQTGLPPESTENR